MNMAARKLKITCVALLIFLLDNLSLAGCGRRLRECLRWEGYPLGDGGKGWLARCWLLDLGMGLESQVPGFGGEIEARDVDSPPRESSWPPRKMIKRETSPDLESSLSLRQRRPRKWSAMPGQNQISDVQARIKWVSGERAKTCKQKGCVLFQSCVHTRYLSKRAIGFGVALSAI